MPALILAVTASRPAPMDSQGVRVQQMVLRVTLDLQDRMFAVLVRADLARVEREPPASLATRFTNDAAMVRDILGSAR